MERGLYCCTRPAAGVTSRTGTPGDQSPGRKPETPISLSGGLTLNVKPRNKWNVKEPGEEPPA